jgi:hypothetical protein
MHPAEGLGASAPPRRMILCAPTGSSGRGTGMLDFPAECVYEIQFPYTNTSSSMHIPGHADMLYLSTLILFPCRRQRKRRKCS